MRIVFWGKGPRAESCFREVSASGHDVMLMVTHPFPVDAAPPALVASAREKGIEVIAPEHPNSPEVELHLASLRADMSLKTV